MIRDEKELGIYKVELDAQNAELLRVQCALQERVKELEAIYKLSEIVEDDSYDLSDIYQKIVDAVAHSWRYPEITCCSLKIGDLVFKSDNFVATEWKQSSPIKLHAGKVGEIAVYYTEERPFVYEGPFLHEERLLLNVLAERIGNITKCKRLEEKSSIFGEELFTQNEELKLTQLDLEEQRHRYFSLFNLAPVGYIIQDKKGVVIDANLTACRMLNAKYGVLVGSSFSLFVHKEHMDECYLNNRRMWRNDLLVSYDLRILPIKKHPVWVQIDCLLEDGLDSARSWCTITDISARKEKEELLDESNAEITRLNLMLEQKLVGRTNELSVVNQEIEDFSYTLFHDIRAPLRHINGFSNLLREECVGTISKEGNHYLDVIGSSVSTMDTLIERFLQFYRSGRVDIVMEEVDMEALVTTLIGNMESQARWTIEELPTVVGDIDLLEQVWSNLLDNAVKFSRNSNPSKINIGCCPSGDEIFFYVRDNGVGFDRLYADKLFGVFQRLNTKFEGTGVGLATVKRGVTRMGGRVFAESEAGKGATIYFSLPVKGNDDKYS